MNKKGFLLAEETLKMIIALIAISFLIYFLTALYFSNQDSENLELAESSLEHLMEEINSESKEVLIFNPEGWVIISWPYEEENKLPNSCSNLGWESCVCIAEDINLGGRLASLLPFTTSVRDRFLENSDKKGICLENNKELLVKKEGENQQPIPIESPLTLKINYEEKTIMKNEP